MKFCQAKIRRCYQRHHRYPPHPANIIQPPSPTQVHTNTASSTDMALDNSKLRSRKLSNVLLVCCDGVRDGSGGSDGGGEDLAAEAVNSTHIQPTENGVNHAGLFYLFRQFPVTNACYHQQPITIIASTTPQKNHHHHRHHHHQHHRSIHHHHRHHQDHHTYSEMGLMRHLWQACNKLFTKSCASSCCNSSNCPMSAKIKGANHYHHSLQSSQLLPSLSQLPALSVGSTIITTNTIASMTITNQIHFSERRKFLGRKAFLARRLL